VAVKVIRPGIASPELVKRFTREAQVLGRLHHPGIAQIYEAGVAADGQPFFAMELIRGLPLTEYARHLRLDTAARLAVAAKVCDAVQHAHEKGVIHRDLKPGNIPVDETGQPKVLDFGVARATDADLQTTTGRTEVGQLIGTLAYMSPEQMAADPRLLDRRADVYALGVILFELLAGRLPYDLQHLPLAEVARVIRDQEPSRLGSIDTHFRGDIETIVARALEKDKSRRYASAAELASDLRRYLNQEPILARPPSALYQLRKFARRNKALVGGVAGVLVALVLGMIGTTIFAVGEAEQRRQAEHNARVANDEKRAALFQAYRARLAAAGAALWGHDVADAARQLGEAPEALRDWEWRHLHSRLDDSSAVIHPPVGGRLLLARGPGGLRLASVTGTGLRLTDENGRGGLVLPLPPPPRWVHHVEQKRRGVWVVGSGGDKKVSLLDEAGKVRLSLADVDGAAPGPVAFSPGQTRMAIAWGKDFPNHLELYETASGKKTATCAGHQGGTWSVAFSPDGTRVAAAGDDGAARLWDAATGAMTAEFRGHTFKVLHVAFRPDGGRVLTASADGTVRQWDPRTARPVEPPYERHTGEVHAAVYSPDGQWVASGGTDRTVRLWRATGREEVALLHGHTGAVTELAFTPDGRRLASASLDGTVRVWEADPRAGLPVLRGHEKYVYPVACSPDGRWIASGSWDHTVRLWDARTGEPCAELSHPGVVPALAFGPDGSWLVSGCLADDRLRVWDVASARPRKEIKGPGEAVWSLAVSPDGSRIAAVDWGGTMGVWEAATGQEIFSVPLGGARKRKVLAYSPEGRWLAGSVDDRDVYLWDARTHRLVARLSGHEGEVHSVAFSPDGGRLVTAGLDRTVRVWDVEKKECQAVLRGHTDEVFAAAFHPGGTRIASAGRDRAVWLWDVATGEEVARLQGHTNYVYALAFSPDGTTLVSGSGDGTVRLWDTAPLARRHHARREAEALRPEAERLVERLFREKGGPSRVVEALQADEALAPPLRQAALRAVLRRVTGN
jgi:WD40 repeat protein